MIEGRDNQGLIADRAPAFGWPQATAVWGLAVVCLLAVFWQSTWSMVRLWAESSIYGHCFLIAPASAYLVWLRRSALEKTRPVPCVACAIALVLPAAAWLLGNLTGTQIVQHLALILMIQMLTWTIFGTQVLRLIFYPLVLLFLAVPIGGFLVAPLQDLTAQFVVGALQLTGMPVYIDGWMIHIPSGRFHVAEACSGLSFLISSIALGAYAANLMFRSYWRRAFFMLLAVVVPIVANGFRAYGIIMLAHWSDYRIAAGVDHLTYGLIFLSLVTLCLLGLGMTFRERGAGEISSVVGSFGALARPGSILRSTAAAGLMALVAVSLFRGYALYTESRMVSAGPVSYPDLVAPKSWHHGSDGGPTWRPNFNSADKVTLESFTQDDMSVAVFVALYSHQRQGHEVVTPTNSFAPSPAWSLAQGGKVEAVVEGEALPLGFQRLHHAGTSRLVWYWYWVDGRYTANPIVAKLLDARAKLLGGDSRAAVIAVSTIEHESPAQAGEVLQKFLDDAGRIRSVLEATSSPTRHNVRRPG